MSFNTILAILCVLVQYSRCDGDGDFCYSIYSCAPNTWPGICLTGRRQSPVNIRVPDYPSFYPARHPVDNFSFKYFKIQNDGHGINLEFPVKGSNISFFPGHGFTESKYKLVFAQFHWGDSNKVGSEHTLSEQRYPMEMHLIHYHLKHNSFEEAINSEDKDALAIVGVFFRVVQSAPPNPALQVITRALPNVTKANEDHWVKVKEEADGITINLAPLLPSNYKKDTVYHYKGSLTRPDCAEQVNWYLYETPVTISPDQVDSFRKIKGADKEFIKQNWRPLQFLFGRIFELYKLF